MTRAIADARRDPNSLVHVTSDLGELATSMAQGAADAVTRSFQDRIPIFLEFVRSRWPIKTGYSQSQFRLAVKQVDAFFQVAIINQADYSGWIRHRDGGNPKLVAVRLLFNPFDGTASLIARDIAQYLEV